MKLAVAATAPFGADVLERLAAQHEITALLTRPDKPAGRGRKLTAPPAKQVAERLGIPVLQPERLEPGPPLRARRGPPATALLPPPPRGSALRGKDPPPRPPARLERAAAAVAEPYSRALAPHRRPRHRGRTARDRLARPARGGRLRARRRGPRAA